MNLVNISLFQCFLTNAVASLCDTTVFILKPSRPLSLNGLRKRCVSTSERVEAARVEITATVTGVIFNFYGSFI